jgi:hypothetical protein
MHQPTAKPRNPYQASKPNLFYSHKPHCHNHLHLNQNKQLETTNHEKTSMKSYFSKLTNKNNKLIHVIWIQNRFSKHILVMTKAL